MVASEKQWPGLLVVFEGTDGTGKSTQLQLLSSHLKAAGYQVVITKEPTEGPWGQKIRQLYSNRGSVSPAEELELFLADRRDHVNQLLLPSLMKGCVVLCDRYYLSTVAYQGAAGLDPQQILAANSFAPPPDLALLFTLPVEKCLQRITVGRGDALNDFEKKSGLERVAEIFSSMQLPYLQHVDADAPVPIVQQRVLELVKPLLPPQPC